MKTKIQGYSNLAPAEWNPIFETRRDDIDYAAENKALIDGRDLEDGVVRCFMKSRDESDACLPRADRVEEYCFGATLDALEAEKGEEDEPNAWLDERSSAGGKEQAREYRGLLGPRTLYQALKRPVSDSETRRLFTSRLLTCRTKGLANFNAS
jgi:hypothetical protein